MRFAFRRRLKDWAHNYFVKEFYRIIFLRAHLFLLIKLLLY